MNTPTQPKRDGKLAVANLLDGLRAATERSISEQRRVADALKRLSDGFRTAATQPDLPMK